MGKLGRAALSIAVALLAVGLFLRACVFTVWAVPDDAFLAASVAPTLRPGDTVLVLTVGTPVFGELVRCPDPQEPTKFVVGRIAGVERDVVDLQGANLAVDGERYEPEGACPEPTFTVAHPTTKAERQLHCDVVHMGAARHFRGTGDSNDRRVRTEVLPGKVFLVSDNRVFHDDSRDFGLLARSSCMQRIAYRIWGKDGATFTVVH